MKATVILLLLLPGLVLAQEKPAPAMLLGAIFNTDRAALHFSMYGPDNAGYIQIFLGANLKEHELQGTEVPGKLSVSDVRGVFPLRTYHAGLLYSHIIRNALTIGIGAQYREYREYTQAALPTTPATLVYWKDWYEQRFDFAAQAGWIFGGWLYASVLYTTNREVLLGVSVAVK